MNSQDKLINETQKKYITEITDFENIVSNSERENILKKTPISGTLKSLTSFIIYDCIRKLQNRFQFYKKIPEIYNSFERINLNPWLFYIYMCQLISKFKIGTVIQENQSEPDFKDKFFTNKYQKNFYKNFEYLKQKIKKNLEFISQFCGKLKFNQSFDTHKYGLLDSQIINSEDIDLIGIENISKTFGITPKNLTMSDDNFLINLYKHKIVKLHILLEIYQSIIHPKILELITEFTEHYILQHQTKPKKTVILLNSTKLKQYNFIKSNTENYFYIYEYKLLYKSFYEYKQQKINLIDKQFETSEQIKISKQINKTKQPKIKNPLIIKHLDIIKSLYGAILNFNQGSIFLTDNPYETELYDFLIDYRIFEYKYQKLTNVI